MESEISEVSPPPTQADCFLLRQSAIFHNSNLSAGKHGTFGRTALSPRLTDPQCSAFRPESETREPVLPGRPARNPLRLARPPRRRTPRLRSPAASRILLASVVPPCPLPFRSPIARMVQFNHAVTLPRLLSADSPIARRCPTLGACSGASRSSPDALQPHTPGFPRLRPLRRWTPACRLPSAGDDASLAAWRPGFTFPPARPRTATGPRRPPLSCPGRKAQPRGRNGTVAARLAAQTFSGTTKGFRYCRFIIALASASPTMSPVAGSIFRLRPTR